MHSFAPVVQEVDAAGGADLLTVRSAATARAPIRYDRFVAAMALGIYLMLVD